MTFLPLVKKHLFSRQGYLIYIATQETVYNGHLRRPVALTPISERLEVELSLPVFKA